MVYHFFFWWIWQAAKRKIGGKKESGNLNNIVRLWVEFIERGGEKLEEVRKGKGE